MTTFSSSSPPAPPALRFLAAYWGLGRALGDHLNPLLAQTFDLELRAFLVLSSIPWGVAYPSDLADRLSLPRDTMSRTLQTLLKRGLIAKQIDPDDSRRVRLSLTPAGDALRREVKGTLEAVLEPLLQDLEPEALTTFLATAETLKTQLSQRLGESCAAPVPSR